MNNKAVSAVIGVILMIAITIAIAATCYVYVTERFGCNNENKISVTYTGILTGIRPNDFGYTLYFNENTELNGVHNISDKSYYFIINCLDKNVTIYYDLFYDNIRDMQNNKISNIKYDHMVINK